MNISREQYHLFLTDQCAEDERAAIISYLDQHPEILEQWLQAGDWEQFREEAHLHPVYAARMRHQWMAYINGQRQRRQKRYRFGIAVAIAALTCSLLWLWQEQPAHPPAMANNRVSGTPAVSWEEVRNSGSAAKTILPGDGSVIKLYGNSSLRYKKGLDSNRRAFYLQGVAVFEVAKDKHRPFTVYAGGTATTALGTSFKVKAPANEQAVQVKLYEGKLVVQAGTKAVYLFPGDELSMDAGGEYHKTTATGQPPVAIKKHTPALAPNALVFTNMPLATVLEQLKRRFGAAIRYDANAISTINVTATFTEQDTLSDILNILCTLNDLQLQSTGTTFAISR